ncbi:RNA dependent RNA polymerase [Wheat umbra-like virus]|nr:RNA dependent RNA polymerase [Wheat umbra-like virus]
MKYGRRTVNFSNLMANDIYKVHANSKDNLLRGFCTRVWRYKGADPIPCLRSRLPRFERAFRGFPVRPVSYDSVVENALPRRRKLLQTAVESLKTKPLQLADSHVNTFIKAEKFCWSAKPDADPRLIQPRGNRFLVSHGRYIKAIEPMVYKALGRLTGLPMVAKGFNARETAEILRKKWDRFRDPVCISLDASRFDQHVSVDMLKFTHRIYRRFNRDPEFKMMCDWQLHNTGFASCPEGSFKYKIAGRRMSGDMDTSLGNCVIMCGLTYELFGPGVEIFNNGDDCLVIGERHELVDAPTVREHYKQYGFHVVEEDRVDVFERILFCQTQPIWAEGWVMCRHPRMMAKDLTYIGPHTADRAWLDAIGQCGIALADGVPIMSRFYHNLIDTSHRKANITNSMLYSCGLTNLAKRMEYKGLPISDRSRYSFYLGFGVEPDVQVAIEASMGPLGNIQRIDGKLFEQTITNYESALEAAEKGSGHAWKRPVSLPIP